MLFYYINIIQYSHQQNLGLNDGYYDFLFFCFCVCKNDLLIIEGLQASLRTLNVLVRQKTLNQDGLLAREKVFSVYREGGSTVRSEKQTTRQRGLRPQCPAP